MTIPKPLAIFCLTLPWIGAAVVLIWLCILRYPLSGAFHVVSYFDGKSPWVQPFLPATRATSAGIQADGWLGQRLTDEPVYFTARVPGPYEQADVTLEYRPIYQPLIEFGLVRDAQGKELELLPMYAEQLQSEAWKQVKMTGAAGYVREGTSSARLTSNDPRGLAVWDATATPAALSDPAHDPIVTTVSLRGSHDFYVVPAGGVLRMRFVLQAANRKSGSDSAVFRVYRGDEEVKQEALTASGSRERRMGQQLEHEVVLPHADPIVYRIAFIADDDVFIRQIETTSQHWVVGPRVYFGDVVGFATSTSPGRAMTNSRHLVAETFHQEGIQTMSFGSQKMKIQKTHTATRGDRVDAQATPVEVLVPNGDLRLVGDGFFALRDEAFFEPRPRRLTDRTDLERESVQAIITAYERPRLLSDGWMVSTFRFRLRPNIDQLRFVLSAPGMAARVGAVDIRRVEVTYRRSPMEWRSWLRVLHQELANARHRL